MSRRLVQGDQRRAKQPVVVVVARVGGPGQVDELRPRSRVEGPFWVANSASERPFDTRAWSWRSPTAQNGCFGCVTREAVSASPTAPGGRARGHRALPQRHGPAKRQGAAGRGRVGSRGPGSWGQRHRARSGLAGREGHGPGIGRAWAGQVERPRASGEQAVSCSGQLGTLRPVNQVVSLRRVDQLANFAASVSLVRLRRVDRVASLRHVGQVVNLRRGGQEAIPLARRIAATTRAITAVAS